MEIRRLLDELEELIEESRIEEAEEFHQEGNQNEVDSALHTLLEIKNKVEDIENANSEIMNIIHGLNENDHLEGLYDAIEEQQSIIARIVY